MKLKDIGIIVTGNTPSKKNNEYYESNDILFVKPSDIEENYITSIERSEEYISEKARKKARILPEGAVLVTCIGTIGKVGILKQEATCNQQINAIIPNDKVISKYLAYLMQSRQKMLQLKVNAPVVPIINKTDFSEIEINICDIEQQKQIVRQLDLLRSIIDKRKVQIDELQNIVKSQFVEMFGDIVNNDKKWKQIRLEDISEIKSGGTPTRSNPEFFKGTIPWITTISLGKNVIDEYDAVEFITEEAINKSATKLVEKESLLFGIRVGVGKISMNKVPMCMNQDIVAITNINSRFRKLFLKKAIEEYSEYFNNQKRGATIQGITSNILKKIKLPVIELELQDKYLTFLNQMDKQKFEIENSLKDMQELYESLMEKYFG